MKHRWIRLFALTFFLLSLVACSTSTDEVAGEVPEFTDADIDAAQALDSASAERLNLSARLGDPVEFSRTNPQSALGRANGSGFGMSNLNTTSAPEFELDADGHIAYISTLKLDKSPLSFIRLRKTNKIGVTKGRLIYKGRRGVDSVAVSPDGTLLTFIMQAKDGNYEVYAHDRTGDTFGIKKIVRLTQTAADESNISMSLDAKTHLWQGVDEESGLANFTLATIDLDAPTVSVLVVGAPFGLLEPSLSGDASLITLIADLPAPTGEVIGILPSDLSAGITGLFNGADFSAPSLSFAGDAILFKVTDDGADLIGFDDGSGLSFLKEASEASIDHPFLTAGANYLIYSLDGEVRLSAVDTANPGGTDEEVVDEVDNDVNSATYWAKPGLSLRYFSTTLGAHKFTRPDDGSGLSDEERTNAYHAYSFRVPVSDFYEVLSSQDFDGYLLLYEGNFNPRKPERNLIAENDDFGGSYDPDNNPAGTSRVLAELERGKRYTVVTTACGDPDAGCGPNEGAFVNIINRSEPPPPPFELPEPDNSRYNITLRIVNEEGDLTEEQLSVLTDAAERWSNVITEDLNNIESFNLPANFTFPDTGEVIGTLDDVLIDLAFTDLGGPGGLLGRAGPRLVRDAGTPDEFLTIYGLMEFDIRDFEEGGFFEDMQQYEDVIVHEMGHVIGIGTLWQLTGNTDGIQSDPPTVPAGLPNPDYDPRFTGAGAIEEYRKLLEMAEYDLEDSVPIANTGGPGNFNGHWREITFDNELMTPFAGGTELLSRMTAASLADLGYTTNRNSGAVDQDYVLPPPRVPAKFFQTAPNDIEYQEGSDFLSASDGAKATAAGAVVNVDLNLADLEDSTSACEAEDFDSSASGKIVLVRRGACAFADKVVNAQNAGATAVIIMNQGNAEDRTGLLDPNLGDAEVTVPVLFVTFDVGSALAGTAGLEASIDTSGNDDPELGIGSALRAPEFEEEVLLPIGTVTPNGKIKLFD